MVWVFRWVCARFLKNNDGNPNVTAFFDDINTKLARYQRVLKHREEAEGLTFMFMCSALNVKIKHYTLSGDYDFHIETFHPISPEGPEEELDTLHMLWKPGHYDVLYRKEDMMRD